MMVKKKFFRTTPIGITIAVILFNCLTLVFAQPDQLDWTFQVEGAVNNNLNLTLEQLAAMPSTTVQGDIFCGGSFVKGGDWTGSTLSQILEKAEINQETTGIEFTATDGYTVTIPLIDAMRDDTIIAYQLNGQSLPEALRLVIPRADGYYWISMINQINVSTTANPEPIVTFTKQPNFNGSPSTMPTPMQATPAAPLTPTPIQTPTPTPDNQTAIHAATPSTESQPQTKDSATPSIWEQYIFPTGLAAMVITAVTVVTGSLIRKHRIKNPKTQL
jgi:DMSO/TMAO reductase YedYZ molybdopterin-dependent catalytic subunit